MIKRSFGGTGLMVSALGLGCNNFGRRLDLEKTRTLLDSAIEAGINFYDTADVYGNRGESKACWPPTSRTRRPVGAWRPTDQMSSQPGELTCRLPALTQDTFGPKAAPSGRCPPD